MKDCNAIEFPYHKIFLLIGLIFGIVWLFLLPPFQGPDEFVHFDRAYMLSEGKLKFVVEPASGRIGHYLPASIKELEDTLQSRKIAGRRDVKQNLDAMAKAAKIQTKPEATLFYDNIAYYPPLAYAPHVAAITIARILELPIIYVYYAARLGGLIFFLGIMYLLIKYVRILKLPLLTIALMPISIQQGLIVSADCVTIMLILMLVCYVINMTFHDGDKVIDSKDMAVFYLLCALIAITKGPYVVLALLYFMIPRKRCSSGIAYWAGGIGMILVGVLLMAAWKFLQTDLSTTTVGTIVGVTSGKNTDLFHILHRVFIDTMFSVYLAKSAFWLGWTDVRLPVVFLASYTFLMLWPILMADTTIDQRVAELRKTGFIIIAFIFCAWTAYHISMYLAEFQRPEGKILGMQGRYFVRLLFPLLVGIYLVIPGKWRLTCSRLPWRIEVLIKIHCMLLALFLAVATGYIFFRYYG
jgi:uncharacterized membrane protein